MDEIKEYGQRVVDTEEGNKIQVITIIGEIEGHDLLSGNTKATKYEHIIPKLIEVDCNKNIEGVLFVLNTIGGDVECGLAIAELITSLRKPTVSLVIGGSHSIGIPLAVSTDYSFIAESATMLAHPVRMTGTVLGAPQTYYQFNQMQERIVSFICKQSNVKKDQLEELMMAKDTMARDLGTILVGKDAVTVGIIDEVGGLGKAMDKLKKLIAG